MARTTPREPDPASPRPSSASVTSDAGGSAHTAVLRTRWSLALAVAFIGLVVLVFFAPLFHGKTLSNVPTNQQIFAPWQTGRVPYIYPQADQANFIYPNVALQTKAWRSGTIPLINSYNMGGNPLFADGSAGVLYPPRILLALSVSPSVNHDLYLLLHLFAGGVFMLLLLREFRLHPLASLLGATAWAFASWNVSQMQLEIFLPICALLPAALLLIHRSARTRSWRTAVLAGVPLALMAIGANVQFAAVAFVICGLYAVAIALDAPDRRHFRPNLDPRRLAGPVLALAVGVGLSAVVLLPTVLSATQGGRQPVSYSFFAQHRTISAGAFERVFSGGGPTLITLFVGGAFVGIVPFGLAFVGFLRRRPGAALGRWLAAVTFLFVIGTPIITWLGYQFIPGMSRISTTGYLLWVFDLGMVILAALGLDLVIDWSARIVRHVGSRVVNVGLAASVVALAVGLGAVGTTAVQLVHYAQHVNPPFSPRRSALLYPATPAIVAAESRSRARPRTSPQRLIGFGALFANQSEVFLLETADGYGNVVPSRVRRLWTVVAGRSVDAALKVQSVGSFIAGGFGTRSLGFDAEETRLDLLPRVGVTTLIVSPAFRQLVTANAARAGVALRPVYLGRDAELYDLASSPSRGWLVHRADVVADASTALHQFAAPSFDYRDRVVLEADQGVGSAGQVASRGSGPGTAATRDSAGFNGTAFTVRSSTPGWLVMADMYYPGWRVTVNGRDARLLRANYALRAVAVPSGASHLVLTYRPPGFVAGLVVSVVVLLALLVLLVWWLLSRRSPRRRGDPVLQPAPQSESRRQGSGGAGTHGADVAGADD
jgi:Bacterial membrane protein YfhO